MIYLDPEGKDNARSENGFIEKLLQRNYLVAAADLSGIGETGDSLSGIKVPYSGVLIGRSLPGFHAGRNRSHRQFRPLAGECRSKQNSRDRPLRILGPALLHAAAFEPSLNHIAVLDSFLSYASIAMNERYQIPSWSHVAGALPVYDLPDLAACITPRSMLFLSPTDPNLQPVNEETFRNEYAVAFQSNNRILLDCGPKNESDKQNRLIHWLHEMIGDGS